MRKIMRIGFFAILSGWCSLQVSMAQGYLKVKGTHLENDQSNHFILRGMGLGGWMLQEGYMFHLGFLGQQYKIREKITDLIGPRGAADFYDKWYRLHTQAADIDSMASWGFNSIRLPMNYDLFTLAVKEEPVKGANTWLPRGFQMVDELLSWCRKNKIYLILDLHAAPGGQGNDLPISNRNPAEPSLWESRANQDKTVALWKELAKRYADEPYIGGYDILNETNWGFEIPEDRRGIQEKGNIPLRELLMRITSAIREVDSKHIIFLEGNGFANNYQGMFPLWDDNLVLSFHKYGNFSTRETIQQFLKYRDLYQVPLWLGESGENSNTWFTNTIRLMEDNQIGWCWWQLKKMGINNPLEIREPRQYKAFVDFCNQKGERPDSAVSVALLNEFLENLSIENNIYHPDVIDAMFRQVHSTATIPFKPHIISGNTLIKAVDFDMGRNGYAYADNDTASYQYTPGVHSQGNRGWTYRNDGVDIHYDKNQEPVIFDIEDGEWLRYTLQVSRPGEYRLTFHTSGRDGKVGVSVNDQVIQRNISIAPLSEAMEYRTSTPVSLFLSKGINTVSIYFKKGGFELKSFSLEKKSK